MTPVAVRRVRAGIAVSVPLVVAGLVVASFGSARVVNDSMTPTLAAGSVVVYDRLLPPARGDIVLFVDPGGWADEPGAVLVKRVIGIAGDTVACCEAGTGNLVVNGQPLAETYIDAARPGGSIRFAVTVPPDGLWVMGDNRSVSRDSRSALGDDAHGTVPASAVRGVVRGAL